MFSRRLSWPFPSNRLSRLLEEKRARGARVLDLTESNPTRVGLEYPCAAIEDALRDAAASGYEPSALGLESARVAVAEWLARRGRPATADRILLTASTSEAYAFLFKLLADPGDRVLVPRPSYPLFDYLASLEGVRTSSYPLTYDTRWSLDLDALESGSRTGSPPRAIVVVNPNNPTGSPVRQNERPRLEDIAARANAAIVSDEVFFDYLGEPPIGSEPSAGATARGPEARAVSLMTRAAVPEGPDSAGAGALKFVLGGLSKACGLPQMKLAWMVVGGPEDRVAQALERLELIADTYLSVGTPVQRATARLLSIGDGIHLSIQRRIATNAERLRGEAGAVASCGVLAREGGWSAVLQVPAVRSEEELVLDLLARDDVLVQPGYFFDFSREAYLVLSLLVDPEIFAEALRRLLIRFDRS